MSARIWILATQNPGKKRELAKIVNASEPGVIVKTLDEVGLSDLDVVEDKDTFAGNARLKVDAVTARLSPDDYEVILADDSGIAVDALDGAPGVRSARFAADHEAGQGDEDNNALLLDKLRDTELRTARFVCAIECVTRDGRRVSAFGTVEGKIAHAPRGEGGFGYDPLFVPDAYPERHMAELDASEKHAISHRGKATREVVRALLDASDGSS